MQIPPDWKMSVKVQCCVCERQRASGSPQEEWGSIFKAISSNLGSTAAKFNIGLATLALLQDYQDARAGFGLGQGEGVLLNGFQPRSKGFLMSLWPQR